MMNPYVGLYDEIPSVAEYLERLKLPVAPSSDIEGLNCLIRAHISAIPFENLEIFYGEQTPSLATVDLFEKMVRQKRGGYCFELNGLFQKLLVALGFQAYCVGVRILDGKDYLPPVSHRGVIVEFADGLYYADVGFGGPGPVSAIRMANVWQQSGSREYRCETVNNVSTIWKRDNTGDSVLFRFGINPWDEVDFLGPNYVTSVPEDCYFRTELVISRVTPSGYVSLENKVLHIKENGILREQIIQDKKEMEQVIRYCLG